MIKEQKKENSWYTPAMELKEDISWNIYPKFGVFDGSRNSVNKQTGTAQSFNPGLYVQEPRKKKKP